MKSILTLAAAVCALSAAGAAQACGAPCPAPTPAPSPAASPEATSRAQAGAQAGAVGQGSASIGSVGGGSASLSGQLGGTASAQSGSAAGGASSLADNSTSRALALSLFVQPPAFTPPMAQVACASAQVKQEASSTWIVLGGHSSATSTTDASDCTLLNIRNAMVKECKYASAKQVEDLLVQKHLPKFQPNAQAYTKSQDDPGYVDYTPTQCAVLLSPPPPAPKLVMLEDLAPPAPKPKARKKGPPPCVWQCIKPKTPT